jgi:hypothetical protein
MLNPNCSHSIIGRFPLAYGQLIVRLEGNNYAVTADGQPSVCTIGVPSTPAHHFIIPLDHLDQILATYSGEIVSKETTPAAEIKSFEQLHRTNLLRTYDPSTGLFVMYAHIISYEWLANPVLQGIVIGRPSAVEASAQSHIHVSFWRNPNYVAHQ